jgi:membrane protein implicated in regulation of membrane protease activity
LGGVFVEPFSIPLETIYLYGLIIAGIFTVLYVLFADVFHFHGAGDGLHFLNPVLIFAFITVLSACGYLLERLTSLHHLLIFGIGAVAAFIIVSLLNVFVLVPVSSAEESLVYKESDLKGRIGKVITAVPEDGFGEVMIDSTSGRIAKPASSFDKVAIPNGTDVLVVDVKNGVLQVVERNELEKYFSRG